MPELKQKLERLKIQVQAVQNAPLLQKAAKAEQALINAYFLLENIVEEMEQIKNGE
jgi:hypothetical protein